jgi:hypothetical protein
MAPNVGPDFIGTVRLETGPTSSQVVNAHPPG